MREGLGEGIYPSMARKSRDALHRGFYLRLADNERKTRLRCTQELKTLAASAPVFLERASLSLTSAFFSAHEKNGAFRDERPVHEAFQHELMGILQGRPE